MWLNCCTPLRVTLWIRLNTKGGDWAERRGGSFASANINNKSSIVLLKLHWTKKKRILEWFFFFLSQDVHFPLIHISALSWVLASCLSIIYWRHILCWTQRWVTARAWVLWPACCCSICVRRMHSTCSNSLCTTWACGNSTGLIWSYFRYSNINIVTYSRWHQIVFLSHLMFYTLVLLLTRCKMMYKNEKKTVAILVAFILHKVGFPLW